MIILNEKINFENKPIFEKVGIELEDIRKELDNSKV